MTSPKIGLALGSGSARGWAHVGVIRALEDAGIKADIIAGASVGSLVGAAHASRQLDTLESWIMGLTKRDVWGLLDTAFSRGGVMRGNKLMRAIGEQIEDFKIEESAHTLSARSPQTCTPVRKSGCRRARCLIPCAPPVGCRVFSHPCSSTALDDRWRRGQSSTVSMCRALGADYVIAVNLNAHYGRADVASTSARRPE